MALKGKIKDFPLPDIIQFLGSGKKTGMLSITFKRQKASLYFKGGAIVHASMLNSKDKEAIIKMFHIKEGRFHFFTGERSEKETINVNATTVLMEAASSFDKKMESHGVFDKGGAKRKKHNANITTLKGEMINIVRELYGRKSKKLVELINKCESSELALMSACDKIEKYIYVFLDSKNFKSVADRLRHLIEETH
jgi:hypothetical protein